MQNRSLKSDMIMNLEANILNTFKGEIKLFSALKFPKKIA
jgi:hypothetical protein